MGNIIQIGSPPIEVQLRRSAKARRYSLKVSNADGAISLVLPQSASARAAVDFARSQEKWLRAAIAKMPIRTVPVFGGEILYQGRELTLRMGTGRKTRLIDETIEIPGRPEHLAARLRGFLKVMARERLQGATQRYAKQVNREVRRITLRDTVSRWGSCSANGNLMFSWRLIMAPPDILNYVAAHEVAHLVELNHSAAFWQTVRELMPEYETHRHWLKVNGTQLHRFQL